MSATPMPLWAESQLALRREVAEWTFHAMARQSGVPWWLAKTMPRQAGIPWQGGHDEGSFVQSWFGYCLLTGDRDVRDFLYALREDFIGWSHRHYHHGYVEDGECHHETEIFTDYLVYYWLLDRRDDRLAEIIEDVAEHLGNWVPGVPAWYDWGKHMFRSWWLGTRVVRAAPPYDYNSFDTWHLAELALFAFQFTGQDRYLELCADFCRPWIEMFLRHDGPPPLVRFPIADPDEIARIYWSQDGVGVGASIRAAYVYPLKIGGDWETYRGRYQETFMGYTVSMYSVLARFCRLAGLRDGLPALKKLVETRNLFAGEPGAADGFTIPENYDQMREYRSLSGDTCYDRRLAAYEARCADDWRRPPVLPSILLLDHVALRQPWDARMKWAYRVENGAIKECPDALGSPVAAYRSSGDKNGLAYAMDQARVRLRMAGFSLRDGREHGCAVRHFIHGPGSHAAELLVGLAMGWNGFEGKDPGQVAYFDGHGRAGLPDNVAALVEPNAAADERTLTLFNAETRGIDLRIEARNTEADIVCAECGAPAKLSGRHVEVTLPPQAEVRLRIGLAPGG